MCYEQRLLFLWISNNSRWIFVDDVLEERQVRLSPRVDANAIHTAISIRAERHDTMSQPVAVLVLTRQSAATVTLKKNTYNFDERSQCISTREIYMYNSSYKAGSSEGAVQTRARRGSRGRTRVGTESGREACRAGLRRTRCSSRYREATPSSAASENPEWWLKSNEYNL